MGELVSRVPVALGILFVASMATAIGCKDSPSGNPGDGGGGAGAGVSVGGSAGSGGDPGVDLMCLDGIKGLGEIDVDCGGVCPPCGVGKTCIADTDCDSNACENNICAQTQVCYPSGFCWENPWPTAGWLHRVRGSSANDVWAIGEGSVALRWSGKHWIAYPSGTDKFLSGLTFADATHGWAVGSGGTVVAWDGASWKLQTMLDTPELRDVYARTNSDVWAVGDYGSIYHFDGTNWTKVPVVEAGNTRLWSVWAASATNVWIGGENGLLLKWDGATWMPQVFSSGADPDKTDVASIFGVSPTTVWIGTGLAAYGFDGSTWKNQTDFLPNAVADGWASDASNAYIVGYSMIQRWDGSVWTDITNNSTGLRSVWGAAANDVWAVGAAGEIDHHDGASWKSYQSFIDVKLRGISATQSGHALAVGDDGMGVGVVVRREKGIWVKETINDAAPLNAIWTRGPASAMAVGKSGNVFRWDGTSWGALNVPGVKMDWNAIGAVNDNMLWLVGDGGNIAFWNGKMWMLQPSGTLANLRAIHVIDAQNAWAVGDDVILHWNGVTWTLEQGAAGSTLSSVWGASVNDLWAIGDPNKVYRRSSAGVWSNPFSFNGTPISIHGQAENDAWILSGLGSEFYLYKWDGSMWNGFDLPQIAGTSIVTAGTSAWAVGERGEIIRKP
jgi:hypothetical protein